MHRRTCTILFINNVALIFDQETGWCDENSKGLYNLCIPIKHMMAMTPFS